MITSMAGHVLTALRSVNLKQARRSAHNLQSLRHFSSTINICTETCSDLHDAAGTTTPELKGSGKASNETPSATSPLLQPSTPNVLSTQEALLKERHADMGERAVALLLRVHRKEGFQEAERAAALLREFVDPESDGRPKASLKMVEDPERRARMYRNLKLWNERPLFPGSPIDAHKELCRLRGYEQ